MHWKASLLLFFTRYQTPTSNRIKMSTFGLGKGKSTGSSSGVSGDGGITSGSAGSDGSATATAGSNTAANSAASHYSDYVTRFTKLHAIDLVDAAHYEISHAKKILEIGCGTGVFALAYLDRFPKGVAGQQIYCTDFNQAMVDKAQRVVTESRMLSCQTEFHFQSADGTELSDFHDDTFDVIVSVFGIFLIPERNKVLTEVRRVLHADGGVLAMTAWTTTGYNEELRVSGFGANLHDAMSLMRLPAKSQTEADQITTIPTKPQQLLPQFILDWFEPDKVKEILEENAMFSNTLVYRAIHSVCVPNVELLWHTFSATKSKHPNVELNEQQQQQMIDTAKMILGEYVAIDGKIDRPVFIRTVSNIIICQKRE